jgi:hypothetical protein
VAPALLGLLLKAPPRERGWFRGDAVAEAVVDDGFHTRAVSIAPEEDWDTNKVWAEFVGVVYQPDNAIWQFWECKIKMSLVGVMFESQFDWGSRFEGYSLERKIHNVTTLDWELE